MQDKIQKALAQTRRAVLGKDEQIRLALCCLLSGGHLLLEDLPGMGKTTLAHALAGVMGLSFRRIQFTSDLLPADILGGSVFDPSSGQFRFHEGPVFCQVLMADEINRATPRTQSALLEAMEEGQVSLDGETRPLPEPFFVIATQNPSELAGTFPLPESQTDRFLMCLSLGYPDPAAERQLLAQPDLRLKPHLPEACLSLADLQAWQLQLAQVHLGDAVLDYVQRLIDFSRTSPRIQLGLSPRGGLAIVRAARCHALMAARDYVTPDDVQAVFAAVTDHRLSASDRLDLMAEQGVDNKAGHRTLAEWILDSVNVLSA
ncbi:AAA family ATPase [Pseudohongiella sp.]|uniref:AAA+ ATPase domain-containing protein n=1 Tax=marine sediment metagenome TaxID=412755 RepID=A0A0F9YKV9_9ZZZZ|nr:MoxR family ATPase [Pseudohongiella sp.]HDZ09502.1 MoxR family ATPase [Pseudohongiella sp.]HEA63926.1 MoxR family ATPase [Pseudohongiella sp.]